MYCTKKQRTALLLSQKALQMYLTLIDAILRKDMRKRKGEMNFLPCIHAVVDQSILDSRHGRQTPSNVSVHTKRRKCHVVNLI